jgi:hypothetical protein
MRRSVIMAGHPRIDDIFIKDTKNLFDESGGNTGNMAFRYALASHVKAVRFSHWHAPVQEVRDAVDLILLPLANQLGKHTDLGAVAQRIQAYGLPVVGIGLGAQATSSEVDVTLTEGTQQWLRTLLESAPSAYPNVGVRGSYTQAQIEKLGFKGRVAVTGCPSNFINTKDNIAEKVAKGFSWKPRRIAVNAGIPFIPALAKIEQQLARLVSDVGGTYIVQHGIEMVQLARNEFELMGAEKLEICRKYIRPDLDTEQFCSWARTFACAFFDVPGWMDYLKRFDFVVGTRFHGAMLAIQAGVPAGVIAHDSRTHEMCETMGIPVRFYKEISKEITSDNVLDFFEFDRVSYQEKRYNLYKEYMAILNAAEIEPADSLRALRFN